MRFAHTFCLNVHSENDAGDLCRNTSSTLVSAESQRVPHDLLPMNPLASQNQISLSCLESKDLATSYTNLLAVHKVSANFLDDLDLLIC